MEFEEMRKIWDTQNNQPMFAIDEQTMHRSIRRKIKRSTHHVNFFENAMIAITLIVGIILAVDALFDRVYVQLISAAAAILIAIFIYEGRQRRRRREDHFGQSLVDDLDRAIANTDYLIKRIRTMIWWYILPFAVTISISMFYNSKSVLAWLGIIGTFVFAHFLSRWEVRKWHLPRKEALVAMKRVLLEEQQPA